MSVEKLINAEDAAEVLGVHPKTIIKLARDGVVPSVRIGRLWRFSQMSLDAWIKAQINSSSRPCPDQGGNK